MLKEVDKEQLKEDLQNLVETGKHMQHLGTLLEDRASSIRIDLTTLASCIPEEGLITVNVPVQLFNDMVAGLQELLRLIHEEGYSQSNRQMFAEQVYNNLLQSGLSSFLPPEPSPDPKEQAKEELREEERMKRLMSDKWLPPRRF